MNIVQLGHYHTPSGAGEKGTCQTALVVGVVTDDPIRAVVNLKVWTHEGEEEKHLDVRQDDPYNGIQRGAATFHLSGECPWLR